MSIIYVLVDLNVAMFVWFCVVACASAASLVSGEKVKTGQPHKVPVNGTKVLRAAHFAVVEFNRANAEEQFAYKTIVAGINYIMEMLLGRTMCKRIYTADGEPFFVCGNDKDAQICYLFQELQCRFIVTEIPWEGSCVLTLNKCHPSNH
uniref:Cystatin domain-containing protein n=1 Tax=Cyclopterus lumpus TaxID=8103 RepID=A0A8C2ZJJ0_CYCLU